MSVNVVVYANCQSGPLADIFPKLSAQVRTLKVQPVHLLRKEDIDSVDAQIGKADIVVHQPIGDAFRLFGIKAVKQRFPAKRYLSFPSLHFDGYFPHQMYIRKPGGGTLRGIVGDYHDERVCCSFLAGHSQAQARQHLLDTDLAQGRLAVTRALTRLAQKEQGLDVQCAEYIRGQVAASKLFYVMNHPSNRLLARVAVEILNRVGIPFEQSAVREIETRQGYLSNYEFPIEPSVLGSFEPGAPQPGPYLIREDGEDRLFTVEEFIAGSYRAYESTAGFRELFDYAVARHQAMA